jgi:hypothetical protein
MGQGGREHESGKRQEAPLGKSPTGTPALPGQSATEVGENKGEEGALEKAADLQRKLDELEKTLEGFVEEIEPPEGREDSEPLKKP